MARLIAIDYGTKRTGLAVTDPMGIFASPLETVETKQLERYLADYFQREEVSTIVVGIRESGIGKMARRDKSLVDKVSAAIILQDYMASVGM